MTESEFTLNLARAIQDEAEAEDADVRVTTFAGARRSRRGRQRVPSYRGAVPMTRNYNVRLRRWSATITVVSDGRIVHVAPSPASEADLQKDQMVLAKQVAERIIRIVGGHDVSVQLYKATLATVREDQRAYGYIDRFNDRCYWQ